MAWGNPGSIFHKETERPSGRRGLASPKQKSFSLFFADATPIRRIWEGFHARSKWMKLSPTTRGHGLRPKGECTHTEHVQVFLSSCFISKQYNRITRYPVGGLGTHEYLENSCIASQQINKTKNEMCKTDLRRQSPLQAERLAVRLTIFRLPGYVIERPVKDHLNACGFPQRISAVVSP